MRFDAGWTDVPTASTRVRLSADAGIVATARVLWARFKGSPGNAGTVYVGVADVSASHGWPLENNDDVGIELPIRDLGGSIPAGDIWFDAANNGDDVAWALVIQD